MDFQIGCGAELAEVGTHISYKLGGLPAFSSFISLSFQLNSFGKYLFISNLSLEMQMEFGLHSRS